MAVFNQLRWVGVKPTAKTALEPGKQVSIGTSSTEILAGDEYRTAFTLVVAGSVNVHIKLGTGADVNCPELAPGDTLSSDDYVGPVEGIVASGTGRVDVFEI